MVTSSIPLPDEVGTDIPVPLRARAAHHWEAYVQAAQDAGLAPVAHRETLDIFLRILASSDFIANECIRDPDLLQGLMRSGDLYRDYTTHDYPRLLAPRLKAVNNQQDLQCCLRQFRSREMVRIAWRDLAGWSPLAEVTTDLSLLAQACIDAALSSCYKWHCSDYGTPRGEHSGSRQQLVVIGMGKLGAGELNFSSDIDLVFAYPEEGETRGKRVHTSNEEFFTRLGRDVINALSEHTVDGFVFRVDMRLRPFGESGPLATSFDAMEDYYQAHGREWERYAFIKARIVGGDAESGAELMTILKPFVYRRYLDYGAFESLREMKQMIAREVRRKGMEKNIKLGSGGIREIEFIGQAFQLIRGGSDPRLQQRDILKVLQLLGEGGQLPEFAVTELTAAYDFLRRSEHRLQAFNDEQTHDLPTDEQAQLRLAWSMGFNDWEQFLTCLSQHRQQVQSHFEQVVTAPQRDDTDSGSEPDALQQIWLGNDDRSESLEVLSGMGFVEADKAWQVIQGLRESSSYNALSRQGRERMDRLMPLLLGAISQKDSPDTTLPRVCNLIETIARRTAYLALLVEHPMALSQLVHLCAASPWITSLLQQYPILLDGLLDPRALYAPLDKNGLSLELHQRLMHVPADDLEQQMEVLRHFRLSNVLRVAAADVTDVMPLMVVSDHLTAIAEQVLARVLELAWIHMVERHGAPHCDVGGQDLLPGFAIVGYGKLGGIELGYGSDLDIVFLNDSSGEGQQTKGPKAIDNPQFFARLGQRIIHMLNTLTPSGVLYEVDTRLRPDGASGMLVSSLESFRDYQWNAAWTWEHQALVRARVVAGDSDIARQFESIRREILCRKRNSQQLQQEVSEMRERMRGELGSKKAGQFDIKQDPGGIVDIEFLVQYLILRWAHKYPELVTYTDNIRLLDGLVSNGVLQQAEGSLLATAYRSYRKRIHRLALQNEKARVDAGEFVEERRAVRGLWQTVMETVIE